MSSVKPSWKPIKAFGTCGTTVNSKPGSCVSFRYAVNGKSPVISRQISLDDFIETPDDVSEETADCSDRVTLSQALSELAPDERAVVVLSAVQGYTTREIGEILDLPHGTVSSKLYRTLIKLRKKLEQQ